MLGDYEKEYCMPSIDEMVISFEEVIMKSGYSIKDSLEMGENVDEII